MFSVKNKRISNIIQYSISAVVLIACVYYASRQISFGDLQHSLASTNQIWIWASIPFVLLSHWVRAMRWRLFLKPSKDISSTQNLFSAVMIGYFFNSFTLRLGEFVRPVMISNKENMSLSTAGGTIVLERLIDLVFLIFLFLAMIVLKGDLANKASSTVSWNQIYIVIGMFVIFVISIFKYKTTLKLLNYITNKIVAGFSPKIAAKINSITEAFMSGFESIKSPKLYFGIFVYSAVIWILYALPTYLLFFGFHFDSSAGLDFIDALVILVFSGIATSFAPTPGAMGLYHTIVAAAMIRLYGINNVDAFAFATLSHTISYLLQLVVGGFYFLKDRAFLGVIHKLKPEVNEA